MLRRMLIVLMLVSLTSSTNAMTVIFKDYKAATSDEKAFYYLYLDGVREGIVELNVVLEEKRQQPLFCLPERLELTIEQAEDIMMRQAQKMTDNMMSTSVSQRRSRKHRPTRATGPSIYPALISHKSCRKGTLHI